MNRMKNAVIKNSTISFASQIIAMVFQFVNRTVFIYYLGFELLGINGTFLSIFNTLSLAELGFQSAIVYNLYRPLNSGDNELINKLVNIYRTVYKTIGCFILVLTFILTPSIKYILKGIEVDTNVYIYFILMGINSSVSYFLAYKRALVYADQRDYINKAVDSVATVVFSLIKIGCVMATKNYAIFLGITIVQTIFSNLCIHYYCSKNYAFLYTDKVDKELFKKVFENVKNLFVARIASYVYNSTDNLIISGIVNTISVGLYSNYTLVTVNLKNLLSSIVNPITPIIGNQLVTGQDSESKGRMLNLYTYVRWVMAIIVVVPICVLLQGFIEIWAGENGLLQETLVYMLAVDIYIHMVHSALCDFVNGEGLFKQDKYIEIAGAVSNLVFSLILVFSLGIIGVRLGTIISQIIFWVGRAYIVFKYSVKSENNVSGLYVMKNVLYALVTICLVMLSRFVCGKIIIASYPVEFVLKGIITAAITVVVIFITTCKTKEFRFLVDMFKQKMLR